MSGHQIVLQCLTNNYVTFTYNDYIANTLNFAKESGLSGNGYIKPKSINQYKAALVRNTGNGSADNIVPKFTLSVDKAGSNSVVLKEFYYKSTGTKNTSQKVDKIINVAYTTGKIAASLGSGKLPVKSLYDLYKQGIDLTGSGSYFETRTYSLQKGNTKILKADFKSPVRLKNKNNYFEVKLNLSNTPSIKGTKTALSTKFSI